STSGPTVGGKRWWRGSDGGGTGRPAVGGSTCVLSVVAIEVGINLVGAATGAALRTMSRGWPQAQESAPDDGDHPREAEDDGGDGDAGEGRLDAETRVAAPEKHVDVDERERGEGRD